VLTRRRFLGGSLAAAAASSCFRGGPAVVTRRPSITHGVQAGDPQTGRAVIWARCDELARLLVEWDTTDRFASPRRVTGPMVGPDGNFTGLVELTELPRTAQTIAYRVRFERDGARGASAWVGGTLRTPRADRVRVAWSGDTCGQGFGRNPEWGGLRGYAALRAAAPDVFINSGDLIYADNPILAQKPFADGRIWRNETNEQVARVAESLDDFRARFAYNFEDEHLRAFAAEVPVIAQWDDHETRNNWWPGQQLTDERYAMRDVTTLAARSLRATREWTPIANRTIQRVIDHGPLLDVFVLDCRSFRAPNTANRQSQGAAMLGTDQLKWLIGGLARSTKPWKIVACDQPIALIIPDDPGAQEGFANGDAGSPSGRELELSSLISALRQRAIKNVVFVTADVHYAAAHRFANLDGVAPFWEFVAGPIHAGGFGPNELDPTFRPELVWSLVVPPKHPADVAGPWDGGQNFGTLDVTRDAVTATIWGIDGSSRYTVEIPAG
jgi:alkaline phosphatase D